MRNRLLVTIIIAVMAITVFAVPAVSFADGMTATDGKAVTGAARHDVLKVAKVKGLEAKAVGEGIRLTWKKSENATRYIVYRAEKNGDFDQVKVTGDEKFVNKNLKYKTKYSYKVKACVKKDGKLIRKSSPSKVVSAVSKSRVKYFNKTLANKIINTGLKKVGCSYSLGAEGPSSFDCSGFVYWTLKNTPGNKIKPERGSATGMYNAVLKKYSIGKDKKYLKKGDILMFSYDGDDAQMCHTGFYYGDNKVLHASDYGTGVCIQSLDWQQPIAAIIRLP